VTLDLETGATILGSKEVADYDRPERLPFKNAADEETSFFHFALLWGEDIEHVAIVGGGTIDSNRGKRGGPKAIALKRCRFVQIRGIHIVRVPNYCISLLGTDHVEIEGVTMEHAFADGIDPDACRNVRIANCHIECHDDAIVLKTSFSLGERRSTENVLVSNCYMATDTYGFKLGTESGGDFKQIAVSNCVVSSRGDSSYAQGGIGLESVDGANIEGVAISNLVMHRVDAPIFLRLGNRGRDLATHVAGTLRDVLINNVTASDARVTSSITGIVGHNVQGVTLSNVRITYRCGRQPLRPAGSVPEVVGKYPLATMFDCAAAYGLYCRHVDGLVLNNVQLLFTDAYVRLKEGGTPGPALLCDDVAQLRINMLQARASSDGSPIAEFIDVRDGLVSGCIAPKGAKVFLKISGIRTDGVSLLANGLSGAEKPLVVADDVRRDTVMAKP
jgi:hypothetical protein